MDNFSLSDIASVVRDNDGLGSNAWLIILFVLIFGMGGLGINRNNSASANDSFGNFATASSQNEILLGQKFDAVQQSLNKIGDGLCSSTFELSKTITGEARGIQDNLSAYQLASQKNIDDMRYEMAQNCCAIKELSSANTQKILDAMAQSKIESLSAKVAELQGQLNMSNVVRYPTASVYSSGTNPFCGNTCCNG